MFEERLKALREAKNLTQQKIADDLKIARTTYSNYETLKRSPNIETFITLADYFEVSTDFILCRTDIPLLSEQINQDNEFIKAIKIALYDDSDKQFTEKDKTDLIELAKALKKIKQNLDK